MQKDVLQNNVILHPNTVYKTIFKAYVLGLFRKIVRRLKASKNFIKKQ